MGQGPSVQNEDEYGLKCTGMSAEAVTLPTTSAVEFGTPKIRSSL